MSESTAVDSVVTVAHLHDVKHHFDDMPADDFVYLQMSFLRNVQGTSKASDEVSYKVAGDNIYA